MASRDEADLKCFAQCSRNFAGRARTSKESVIWAHFLQKFEKRSTWVEIPLLDEAHDRLEIAGFFERAAALLRPQAYIRQLEGRGRCLHPSYSEPSRTRRHRTLFSHVEVVRGTPIVFYRLLLQDFEQDTLQLPGLEFGLIFRISINSATFG